MTTSQSVAVSLARSLANGYIRFTFGRAAIAPSRARPASVEDRATPSPRPALSHILFGMLVL